jgi:hypothetical protein
VQVHHEGLTWCKLACITVALLQLGASVLILLLTVYSFRFSSDVRAKYDVYNDVGGASAHMLMPAKTHTYAAFCDDATTSGEIPLCGAALNNNQLHNFPPPYQLPLWALPNDISGLLDLTRMLVCTDVYHLLCVEEITYHFSSWGSSGCSFLRTPPEGCSASLNNLAASNVRTRVFPEIFYLNRDFNRKRKAYVPTMNQVHL